MSAQNTIELTFADFSLIRSSFVSPIIQISLSLLASASRAFRIGSHLVLAYLHLHDLLTLRSAALTKKCSIKILENFPILMVIIPSVANSLAKEDYFFSIFQKYVFFSRYLSVIIFISIYKVQNTAFLYSHHLYIFEYYF